MAGRDDQGVLFYQGAVTKTSYERLDCSKYVQSVCSAGLNRQSACRFMSSLERSGCKRRARAAVVHNACSLSTHWPLGGHCGRATCVPHSHSKGATTEHGGAHTIHLQPLLRVQCSLIFSLSATERPHYLFCLQRGLGSARLYPVGGAAMTSAFAPPLPRRSRPLLHTACCPPTSFTSSPPSSTSAAAA